MHALVGPRTGWRALAGRSTYLSAVGSEADFSLVCPSVTHMVCVVQDYLAFLRHRTGPRRPTGEDHFMSTVLQASSQKGRTKAAANPCIAGLSCGFCRELGGSKALCGIGGVWGRHRGNRGRRKVLDTCVVHFGTNLGEFVIVIVGG